METTSEVLKQMPTPTGETMCFCWTIPHCLRLCCKLMLAQMLSEMWWLHNSHNVPIFWMDLLSLPFLSLSLNPFPCRWCDHRVFPLVDVGQMGKKSCCCQHHSKVILSNTDDTNNALFHFYTLQWHAYKYMYIYAKIHLNVSWFIWAGLVICNLYMWIPESCCVSPVVLVVYVLSGSSNHLPRIGDSLIINTKPCSLINLQATIKGGDKAEKKDAEWFVLRLPHSSFCSRLKHKLESHILGCQLTLELCSLCVRGAWEGVVGCVLKLRLGFTKYS